MSIKHTKEDAHFINKCMETFGWITLILILLHWLTVHTFICWTHIGLTILGFVLLIIFCAVAE